MRCPIILSQYILGKRVEKSTTKLDKNLPRSAAEDSDSAFDSSMAVAEFNASVNWLAGRCSSTASITSWLVVLLLSRLLFLLGSFFWSLNSFLSFFSLFMIWSVVRVNPTFTISWHISSYTLFFLFELSNLSWISVEDHIASSALVSSEDHCCAVLHSDILLPTNKKNYFVEQLC